MNELSRMQAHPARLIAGMGADLGAYIPIDRAQALADGRNLPDRASGAVLFADISGFTSLTAALAQELGPQRGAEEMTGHMNLVYDALIPEVHRYGGRVISFSGDSITWWLDGDSGRRGLPCGLVMQEIIRPLTTIRTLSRAVFTLAIKVAVAAGEVRRFLVGDPQVRCLDVLAGRTLDTMAIANQLSNAGEVLADAETIGRLGQAVAVRAWRADRRGGPRFGVIAALGGPADPAPWPSAPYVSEDRARAWLWPSVYERLLRNPDQLLSS